MSNSRNLLYRHTGRYLRDRGTSLSILQNLTMGYNTAGQKHPLIGSNVRPLNTAEVRTLAVAGEANEPFPLGV